MTTSAQAATVRGAFNFPAQPLARQLKQIRNAQSNGGSNAAIIIRYGGSGATAQPVGWEIVFGWPCGHGAGGDPPTPPLVKDDILYLGMKHPMANHPFTINFKAVP